MVKDRNAEADAELDEREDYGLIGLIVVVELDADEAAVLDEAADIVERLVESGIDVRPGEDAAWIAANGFGGPLVALAPGFGCGGAARRERRAAQLLDSQFVGGVDEGTVKALPIGDGMVMEMGVAIDDGWRRCLSGEKG